MKVRKKQRDSVDISTIPDMDPVHLKQFRTFGVRTVGALLANFGDKNRRDAFSKHMGISGPELLHYLHFSDFLRIKGLGIQYTRLIRAAGCYTVFEMRTMQPDLLWSRLHRTNRKVRIIYALAPVTRIADWIRQAKALDVKIYY